MDRYALERPLSVVETPDHLQVVRRLGFAPRVHTDVQRGLLLSGTFSGSHKWYLLLPPHDFESLFQVVVSQTPNRG